jgi:hypothetical protein
LCAARDSVKLEFPAPPLPPGIELPLFVAPLTADPPSLLDKKLSLMKKEREQAEAASLEFGSTVTMQNRNSELINIDPSHPTSSHHLYAPFATNS